MFNVGGGEIIVILLIALIVLGPDKLPNTARQVGRFMGEIRRMSNGFQQELRDAMSINLDGTPTTGSSGAAGAATPPAMPATASPDEGGAPPLLPSGSADTAPAPGPVTPPPAGPMQVDGPSGSFS